MRGPGGGRRGRPHRHGKGKGAVYRLEDSGAIEQVFALGDGYLTALLPEMPNGKDLEMLVAAGTQGKVYRLLPDRTFALAADLSERQALTLARTGDGFLVGTGDGAASTRSARRRPARPAICPRSSTANFPASGGACASPASNLVFETRSGNTAKPDKSWVPWKRLGEPTSGGTAARGASRARAAATCSTGSRSRPRMVG